MLDPACGSGNFLYLALQSLKDLELRVILHAETIDMARRVVHCGPHNVKGIEINPYAAELARTSIWIGNIQWMRRNGFEARKEPVLEDLQAIECRDALVTKKEDGSYEEAKSQEAEFIVGNPPFVGAKLMNRRIGKQMTAVYGVSALPIERGAMIPSRSVCVGGAVPYIRSHGHGPGDCANDIRTVCADLDSHSVHARGGCGTVDGLADGAARAAPSHCRMTTAQEEAEK